MSNPKGRTIPETLNTFLIMIGIYCLDLFFLKSDLSVLGDNFYARFVSFVALFIILWVTKTPVGILGITKDRKKIATGVVYGIIFSVIPLILVTGVECIYYGFTDITAIDLRFSPPSLNYVRSSENLTPGIAIIIYLFSTFFGSMFKEMFFRGYILKKLKSVLDFKSSNLIQALLYMSLILPYLLRNLVNHYYDDTTTQLGIFIVLFYLFHETLAGIKWGLITRVTGSTYVAIVDHFLYVFLANSLYITDRYVTWSFMTHMMAIQLVSLGIVLIYYKINMKKLLEKQAKEKAEKEAKRQARKERHKNGDYSDIVDNNISDINSISPNQFKSIIETSTKKHRPSHHHHSGKTNERNSELNDGKIENAGNIDASKAAAQYLEKNLSRSHHHSTNVNEVEKTNSGKIESFSGDVSVHSKQETQQVHRHSRHQNEQAEKVNSDKLENISSDEIERKAVQYSDSLSIERQTPKHPHPHDKMALDSLLPVEEIEKQNADKIDNFSEDEIDTFLKTFSEKNSAKKSHSPRTKSPAIKNDNLDDLTDNFNPDDFLAKYQSSRTDSSHTHHHRHHSSNHTYRKEEDIASFTQVNTDNFFDEYQKNTQKPKHRKSLIRTVKELGAIDDSDSNDLI